MRDGFPISRKRLSAAVKRIRVCSCSVRCGPPRSIRNRIAVRGLGYTWDSLRVYATQGYSGQVSARTRGEERIRKSKVCVSRTTLAGLERKRSVYERDVDPRVLLLRSRNNVRRKGGEPLVGIACNLPPAIPARCSMTFVVREREISTGRPMNLPLSAT